MKLYGIAGKGTGKVGAFVYAVRKGEQIVRQYNPNVENPNTRPQVEQRAKFKLLSQLSAAVGNNGMLYENVPAGRSMRNEFTRRNMGIVTVAAGADVATVDATALELTSGSFVAPPASSDPTTKQVTIDLHDPFWDDVIGATAVTLIQPEAGRVAGTSMRMLREEGASSISILLLVPDSHITHTTVLVWVYKLRDDAARARYEQAMKSDTTVSVAFERAVAAGDIIPSMTTVAPFQQA